MSRGIRARWGGDIIGTIFILLAIPIFLFGLLLLLSPTMAFEILSKLPKEISIAIAGDMFLSATPRSWAYMITGAVLWGIGGWLRG